MPARSEVLGNGSIRRQKALGMPRRLETPAYDTRVDAWDDGSSHSGCSDSGSGGARPRQDLPFGRAVALQLVRNDHPWHVLEPLEQLTKELLRRLLVAATLHQNIEDVVVLINRAPQVMALPIDGQKHLVEVPLVPWLGASMLQLIGIVLPKFPTPLADGFMGDVDPAFEQQSLARRGSSRGSGSRARPHG